MYNLSEHVQSRDETRSRRTTTLLIEGNERRVNERVKRTGYLKEYEFLIKQKRGKMAVKPEMDQEERKRCTVLLGFKKGVQNERILEQRGKKLGGTAEEDEAEIEISGVCLLFTYPKNIIRVSMENDLPILSIGSVHFIPQLTNLQTNGVYGFICKASHALVCWPYMHPFEHIII